MEENILREGNKITYYNDKVNAKLMQISDIHYTDGFNTKKFNVIEEQLGIENPDYLLVCGDIFDASEGINIEGLMKWLESVNNYVRIVFSLGNHDSMYRKDGKWVCGTKEYIESLKNLKNSIVLDNEIHKENGINFIGFNNSFDYYEKYRENSTTFYIELLDFFMNINKLDENEFNLLMCHSPYSINMIKHFKENSYFKDIDLILSGHMHGGLVHPLMRPFISEPLGIIAPNKDILPNFTRGITYIDGIPNIISEGVTKLAGMNFVDNMYPVDVKTIKLVRKTVKYKI